MILQFSVGNFRSFNEIQTLDLEPANISELPENILITGKYKALPLIAIYGANASGKSNLIKAMGAMKSMILRNKELNSNDTFNQYMPFVFTNASNENSVFFELTFLLEATKYRYGFEFKKQEVVKEWLFETVTKTRTTEKFLFLRNYGEIKLDNKFTEGKGLTDKTNTNRLFLSVLDAFNSQTAQKILNFVAESFNVISGVNHDMYREFTAELLTDPKWQPILLDFYKNADLGFEHILVKKQPVNISEHLPEYLKKRFENVEEMNIKTIHIINGHSFEFDSEQHESSGTNKILDLSGAIFDTLYNGKVLIIDELDAKLHPLLTLAIINLFHNKEINVKNAQLVFATHDTNILEKAKLRRDQIYFTEKNANKYTNLYSLVEYKMEANAKVRSDQSFEKNYLIGRYGAIPYFGNISLLEQQFKTIVGNGQK